MNTIKKFHGLINLLILIISTSCGTLLGSLTGQIRICTAMGFAAGLTGITAVYYWLGQRAIKKETQSNKVTK
jgi:hypothetical protein